MPDVILFHPLLRFGLLVMRMRLHLIYHRSDSGKGGDVYQSVRIEIGNADGPQHAFLIQILQSSPCSVVIGEGLVQKHEINIVGLQFFQRILYGTLAGVITIMLYPDLTRQEDILTGHAGLFDGRSHLFFVKITLRRVKASVPCL